MSIRRRSVVALGLAALASPSLRAQGGWPTKPVRIVVPFAPGGTTDILARALAPELAKAFGQTFIVENKAGAGGNVGADLVAKSPPDGYTLLMGTVGTQAINPSLYPKMPYDAIKDFVPITLVAGVPNVLVMNPAKARRPGSPTCARLIAYAQRASRQAQHGVERQRHLDPPLGRAVQDDDRDLHGPLPVQGLGAGAARPDRRHDGPDVRQPALGAATDQVRQADGARRDQRERSAALPDVPTIAEAGPVKGFEASRGSACWRRPGRRPTSSSACSRKRRRRSPRRR